VGCRSTSRRGLLVLLLLLPALSGCREERRAAPPAAASSETCRRVIALTPSLVETLFVLGLGDRVVGVGDYSTWPPEVASRPKLGGLFNPNLEKVVTLAPDLAVLLPSERDLGAKLQPLGVDFLIVPNESLADIERSFGIIARRCGVPKAGERLAAQWRKDLAPNPLPGPPPRVMFSVSRQAGSVADVLVAGEGTFYDELLQRLGAVNVFADSPTLYPQVSLEEVVARAPDVILEVRIEAVSPEAARRLKEDWRALPTLPAVRSGRIELIVGDHVVIPGPRVPRLYREIRAALSKAGGS
jgi:iron complex transport system substrate-binding protein